MNYTVHQYGDSRYGCNCTFFKLPSGVASPSRIRPASSSRLARKSEKRTLTPVQLPFLGSFVLQYLGNFTLPIAKRGAIVVSVKGGDSLAQGGTENAAHNGLSQTPLATFFAVNSYIAPEANIQHVPRVSKCRSTHHLMAHSKFVSDLARDAT